MAMTLQELGRRTPPTFYPLTPPPAPAFVLGQPRAREMTAIPVVDVERDVTAPCRCRRCHRLLRSKPSIAAGIGPSCARKEGGAPAALPLFTTNEVA